MKFRKVPVIIEAVQWLGTNYDEVLAFTGSKKFYHVQNDNSLLIPTLEGDHKALVNDWIIRGTAGELYPCKPQIFAEIYEAVK